MKRDATKVIWRTVVFAGAMLGTPACSKKQPQTTPVAPTTTTPADPATPVTPTTTTTETQPTPDPAEDCRVRGCDDDGGGGAGRGFILS
jgi:hypothetical protein